MCVYQQQLAAAPWRRAHMTDGRAFLDIASGDSAIYNIGLAPASRARIADYVTCVRDVIATGAGTYDGRPQRVRWHPEAVRQCIPIALCAEGPKTLDLGGRLFDGVIAGTGLLPEVISDTIERIAAGAREAGRDPAEVEVWFTTRSSLDADRDKAIERIHASVSSILNHSMRFGLEGRDESRHDLRLAGQLIGRMDADQGIFRGLRNQRRADIGVATDKAGVVGADQFDAGSVDNPDQLVEFLEVSTVGKRRLRRQAIFAPVRLGHGQRNALAGERVHVALIQRTVEAEKASRAAGLFAMIRYMFGTLPSRLFTPESSGCDSVGACSMAGTGIRDMGLCSWPAEP